MAAYGLCGKLLAIAGEGETLATHLLEAASALEAVPTCSLYVVSRDPADSDAVWVMEIWDSADAHRASLELEVVKQLITKARPIIAGFGERFELKPIGGKGLAAP